MRVAASARPFIRAAQEECVAYLGAAVIPDETARLGQAATAANS
jgi:hypothetical protein